MGNNGKKAKYIKTVRIRVTPTEYDDLRELAKAHDTSISELVRQAITSQKINFKKNLTPALRLAKNNGLIEIIKPD